MKNWKEIVAERNAEFEKLDDRGKRVRVARDVIQMLDAGQIEAEQGVYIRPESVKWSPWGRPDDHREFTELVLAGEKCHVCALGGLLVAHIAISDKCSVADVSSVTASRIQDRFAEFWESSNLALMEVAFECNMEFARNDFEYDWNDEDTLCFEDPAVVKAMLFGKRYDCASARIRAILHNVIENGEFVP